MSINIHILAASKEMRPYEKRLRAVTLRAVKLVKKFLPLQDIDIVLSDYPEFVIPEIGIGGMTANAHTVFISLDPRHPKFKQAISRKLVGTLAHEFHHIIRWRKPGYGSTLFERLVTEGLAVIFEMEATGCKIPPWSNALTVKQKQVMLKRAKRIFHDPIESIYIHRAWFFGSKKRAIPRWTGYTLGYDIVAAYLKTHPKAKASTLVGAPASLFIAKIAEG